MGCDIGDGTGEICVLRKDGSKVGAKIPTKQKGATKFFEGRDVPHVVMEVGTHLGWISQLIEKLGHRVTVADPRRLKCKRHQDVQRDAELLARLGRADEDLLAQVKHQENFDPHAVAAAIDGLRNTLAANDSTPPCPTEP
jgi:transposase